MPLEDLGNGNFGVEEAGISSVPQVFYNSHWPGRSLGPQGSWYPRSHAGGGHGESTMQSKPRAVGSLAVLSLFPVKPAPWGPRLPASHLLLTLSPQILLHFGFRDSTLLVYGQPPPCIPHPESLNLQPLPSSTDVLAPSSRLYIPFSQYSGVTHVTSYWECHTSSAPSVLV